MRIFLFLLSVSMASRANEQVTFHRIEQAPGPSQVQTVEPAKVESRRKAVYLSYEKFLRQRLEELNRQLLDRCRVELQRQVRGKGALKAHLLRDDQAVSHAADAAVLRGKRKTSRQDSVFSHGRFLRNVWR